MGFGIALASCGRFRSVKQTERADTRVSRAAPAITEVVKDETAIPERRSEATVRLIFLIMSESFADAV